MPDRKRGEIIGESRCCAGGIGTRTARRAAARHLPPPFPVDFHSKYQSPDRRNLTMFPYVTLMTATYPVAKGDMEVQES